MVMEFTDCPFCKPNIDREPILEHVITYSMYDKYPVTRGHTLIIPKRHCANYFELTLEEQISCWQMVNEVKNILTEKYHPNGFNIGVNANEAAGQTVPHVHIHLIPRYIGDVIEREGGNRGVVPDKKKYRQ
jgi:diadenosine tetraphosphate (Ap4A) HIT family hydrolase